VAAVQARRYWRGEDVDPDLSLVTVGHWLDIWPATRHAIRPATRAIYTQLVRDYLKPPSVWSPAPRPVRGCGGPVQHGLPNWYYRDDPAKNPARREMTGEPIAAGVAWWEVAGDREQFRDHIGAETFDRLPLRFVPR
jgi:hypothetical protein